MWLTTITAILGLIHVLGILTAIRAILDVRTAQGSTAWAISLVTFPYVSLPAYWVLGRRRFQGYVLARRNETAKLGPRLRELLSQFSARGLVLGESRTQPLAIEKLASLPFTTGNEVELLVDGTPTFASIFEGVKRAKRYILVEFYIFRADELGLAFQELLISKAREGVMVRIIFDEMGSKGMPSSFVDKFTEVGIVITPFNTTKGKRNRWQLNFRNHRKIVVVDGVECWIGGHNVGNEYLGKDKRIGAWRDTHLWAKGPIATCVQLVFLEDWYWAVRETLDVTWDPQPASQTAHTPVFCLPSGPADQLETCTLFFLTAINSAKSRLWIATPYFVPDEQFISALQLAALRNVDVRIIIPEKSDNRMVDMAAWTYVNGLERVNIRVYRHRKGFMHQKVVLIDDDICTVGSANFDNRSFRLNFEITMAVADAEFGAKVKAMLERDMNDSRLVKAKDLAVTSNWYRFACQAARLMAPVL